MIPRRLKAARTAYLYFGFGLSIALILAMSAAFFYVYQNAIQNKRKSLENVIWTLVQVETELLNTALSLREYAVDPTPATLEDVSQRYDILWSRSELLNVGEVRGFANSLDKPLTAFKSIHKNVAGMEGRLLSLLDTGDPGAARDLATALKALHQPLRFDLVAISNETHGYYARQRAEIIQIFSYASYGTFMLIGALLLSLFMFLRELKNRQLENTRLERETKFRQDAEQRFRSFFELNPDIYMLTALNTAECINVNEGFCLVTGYSRDEVVGQSTIQLNLWKDSRDRERLVAGLVRDGAVKNLEAEFRKKDGTFWPGIMNARFVELDGEKCILSSTKDVTELKETQTALSQQEQFKKQLLDTTLDGYWLVDLDARSIDVNASMCRILDRNRSEILGKSIFDFVDEANTQALEKELKNHSGGEAGLCELALQRPDGVSTPCLVNISPVYDQDGAQVGSVGLWTDVTTLKTVERELEQQVVQLDAARKSLKLSNEELTSHQEQLEEIIEERTQGLQERTEELILALNNERDMRQQQRSFVSMVSHEFRTPLTIIDAGAQSLVRRSEKLSTDDLRQHGESIRNSVTRMVTLIDTVLNSARVEEQGIPYNAGPVQLKSALSALSVHCAEIFPGHEYRLDIDGLPDVFVGDPNLLNHLFENLLSNAAKYSPEASVIDVKGWTEDDDVLISVMDKGVGIPKGELPSMFKRFFRASTSVGIPGSGLGLHICREIVDMHGGVISVESIEGETTTFTVKLSNKGGETGVQNMTGTS